MSEASCVYEAFVNYYCGTSSMFYHVCITFRRYLGIVALPLNNAPIEKWRVALAFAGCQLLSLVLAISPLLGFGSYGLEAHGTSCGLAWNDRSSTGKAYLIGIGTVCYVLPVTITSIVYVLIIKTIRVQQSTVRVMLASSEQAKKRKQEEVHLVITSLGLVVAFVVSWTPYGIVSFYTVFGNPDTINPIISRTSAWFAKTVVVWNPIIYALLSKSFRQKAKQLVRCSDAS
ncbi:opsin-VA-like [Dreissena polymorpha]|uniref:opsin-VA-like n=1 Tax=Dreissena polymorpha TaxID=45954 RepID=UPI002263D9F9|nr:opsin-VA-like [Dreissena polymorpha]